MAAPVAVPCRAVRYRALPARTGRRFPPDR